jgi:Amt family ammonium transporter
VNITGAICIGMAAGIIPFFAVAYLKPKLGYDDTLDAFGIHGVGGTIGAILTGVFADPSINELGKGLLYGNAGQLMTQIIASAITFVYSGGLALISVIITRSDCVSMKKTRSSGLTKASMGRRHTTCSNKLTVCQ